MRTKVFLPEEARTERNVEVQFAIFLSTNPVHQSRQCLINSPPDLSLHVQWWALTKREASYGGQFTFEACNRENFLGTPPGLLPARKR